MTLLEKETILSEFSQILDNFIDVPTPAPLLPANNSEKESIPEMLTIKECTELFKGLSDNTLRRLIERKEIPAMRTGEGKRGKILVEKNVLKKYLSGT